MNTLTMLASVLLAVMLASMENKAQPSDSAADQATRTATIVLNGDVAKVFPLFGPIEEKKWSRGWDPRIVAGGASLQDTVFTYSHEGLTATWIVTEWNESQHRVTYAVFVPNDRAMTIRITCTPEGTRTRATITYTFTALSDVATPSLREFEHQDFALRILHWQKAIDHFLETGQQWQGDSH